MLQVDNHTPFSAALSVFPNLAGVESAYAVVKATFQFGTDGPELAPVQLPLLAADVFWGDTLSTSLRSVGEFGLPRPSTDVLLVGRAIAPAADTRVADVHIQVGPVHRSVRVFGDRRWTRSGGRWRPSVPEPWERMPLRWELAWGGLGVARQGGVPDHEPRNPVGRGFVGHDDAPVHDQPLPNLEDPDGLIADPQDRPTPACFAPIAPTWMPRRRFAGTYDAAWLRKRAPYLPQDFDPRFFQVAPEALVAPGHLQGGEPVILDGFSLGEPLSFTLPACGLSIAFDLDGTEVAAQAALEMLLFEPDAGRLQMLWRAGIEVDKKVLKLRRAIVRSSVYESDGHERGPLVASRAGWPAAYAGGL